MNVGGRTSGVASALIGFFAPVAGFAVGVVLGARISPLLADLRRYR
jgi:hypothetical protein